MAQDSKDPPIPPPDGDDEGSQQDVMFEERSDCAKEKEHKDFQKTAL